MTNLQFPLDKKLNLVYNRLIMHFDNENGVEIPGCTATVIAGSRY
jgi:hypothetical protein